MKRSAGSFGFIGNISLEPQAASNIDSSNNPRQLEFEVERLIDPCINNELLTAAQ